MTSLIAKLPPELQVALEPIRRRLAEPFPRISAQKIFDEYGDLIDKLLERGVTHADLAAILFELGLVGKNGQKPKTNSVSRSLNRSRQTIGLLKLPQRRGADPDECQSNGASGINHPKANGLVKTGSRSSARLNGRVADVSSSTVARSVFETDPVIDDERQNPLSCPVHFCPLFRQSGFAVEPGETLRQGAERVDQGAGGQVAAEDDKARQTTAAFDKTRHGAFRQGAAALDKSRPEPGGAGADDRRRLSDAIKSIGAPNSSDAATKAGIAAASPHAAQAQFPIPPPLSPAQHFARACKAGESLIKLRME
ncbi:hypothetical protein [uncultured Rhodoblastus sp.]|uniref:hypothetical protein n=1 Tax=uncultured Rhodoblastus sp. TaxID=543037 RepID=UPI0025F3E505|nr:hypothetical protein [uncultured Rhodoblastus sp.]